jgi:hypothetical protein
MILNLCVNVAYSGGNVAESSEQSGLLARETLFLVSSFRLQVADCRKRSPRKYDIDLQNIERQALVYTVHSIRSAISPQSFQTGSCAFASRPRG